ncbi:MAG: adenylate/guanylate cyclase domain-containing protein [Candidatus Ozemobacteraceae bacterium]
MKIVPTPPSLSFPSYVPLQTVVKKYLGYGRFAGSTYRDALISTGGDAEIRDFQVYLGSSISLKEFFIRWNDPIECQLNGVPGLWFWGGPGTNPSRGPKKDKTRVTGYFIQIVLSKLPKDFFVKMALRGSSLRIPDTVKTLAFIDEHRITKSLLQSGLPRSPGFARRLQLADGKKIGEIFMVGSFMAMEISTDAGPGKKVFLLLDASPIFKNEQRSLTIIRSVSRLFLFFSFACMILLRRGWGRNLGLAWWIALLLILAILLPIGGALWAGKAVVKELEKQDYNRMYEDLRFQTSMASSRFSGFVTAFGIRLQKRIKQLLKGAEDEPEFIRRMNSITEDFVPASQPLVLISNFYLSDNQGKLSHTSLNTRREEKIVYKILLQNIFQENINSRNDSSGSLGETIMEDITDLGDKTGNQVLTNLPLNTITRFKFGSGEMNLLPILVKIGNQHRILLIQVGEGRMNEHFVRFELFHGHLAKIQQSGAPKIKFFFIPFRKQFKNFAVSPIANAPEISTCLSSYQESSGEFTWKNQQYLFFLADRALLGEYRMLAIAPTSSIKSTSAKRDSLLFAWFLFVLAIVFVTGSILTGKILQPLHQLDFALEKIREGDFTVRLPPMGDDEIGEVGQNVNHMVRELREKERMQAYLSDTTLQAVKDGSAERDLEAQWREVTILFSDIRGFTTLSEKYPPDALFAALNDFFETVELLIRNHGGQVQKFIGDAAYAVFPEAGSAGALGAVSAAMMIMKFLPEFNRKREEKGLFPIAIGIGINTGRVLLGKVGSDARQDFAYIGDEVNLTSELESASKQGKFSRIMVSETTWRFVEDRFVAEETVFSSENKSLRQKTIYEIRGQK